MENRMSFFSKLNKNKYIQLTFLVITMLVLIVSYSVLMSRIRTSKEVTRLTNLSLVDDYNILVTVNEATEKKGKIILSGWGLRINSTNSDVDILLNATDGTEVHVMSTVIEDNPLVSTYFDEKWNFGQCGFRAEIDKSKLRKDVCYEILLVLKYTEPQISPEEVSVYSKKISVKQFLYDGEIYRYNPKEFVPPSIQDEYMQQIIGEGELLTYDLANGIWIYEYDRQIHWIVNYDFLGTIEQSPEILLYLYTSQVEKLPKEDSETQREYISKYLEEQDYIHPLNGEYLVYSASILREYPIIYIETGVYHNSGQNPGWVWMQRLYLDEIVPY